MSLDEFADILFDTHDVQITDEPADPMRQRASSHRGAAYHDPYYPPHGASGGQEGGSMRPEEQIEVFGAGADMVFGSVYARGLDVCGAVSLKAPPRAGFVSKKTPGGRTITTLQIGKVKIGQHKSTVANAKDIGKRAVALGQKLKAATSTAVRGAGLKKPPKKVAPGARRISAAQTRRLADKLIRVGKEIVASADKHDHLVKATAAKIAAGAKAVGVKVGAGTPKAVAVVSTASAKKLPVARAKAQARVRQKIATKLTGLYEVLGAYAECLGEEALSDHLADEVTDAALDTLYGDDAALDTLYGEGETEATAEELPPEYQPDYSDIGPAPTAAPPPDPSTYVPDPGYSSDDRVYDSRTMTNLSDKPVQEGGMGVVYYDGSKGLPYDGFTSFARAKAGGGNVNGYYYTGNAPPSGVRPNIWIRRADNPTDNPNWAGPIKDHELTGGNQGYIAVKPFGPEDAWGPIVGNWNRGDFVSGLRYDYGTGRFFWFRDKAPAWATAADDIVRLNQALLDWKAKRTAAEAEAAAKVLQDKIDAEEAERARKEQAKQDAEDARRMEKEQREAEHQAELESKRAAAEAEAAAKYEERAIDVEEKQARLEEEREQREIEFLAKMAEREAREAQEAQAEEAYYDESGEPAEEHEEAPTPVAEPEDVPLSDEEGVL